jgi:hypothetical protein
VSNRQDLDFWREISGSEKSLADATAAGEQTSEARILNILEFFGLLESPLQEITTGDGTSIWAGEGDPPDLEHHPSGCRENDGLHQRQRRVWRASQQAGEAGVRDTGEVYAPNLLQRPHSRPHHRRPGWYRLRYGCPASCRRARAETPTHEVSSAEAGAVKAREEARPVTWERPLPPPEEAPEAGPEVAALAAGAVGRGQLIECLSSLEKK